MEIRLLTTVYWHLADSLLKTRKLFAAIFYSGSE